MKNLILTVGTVLLCAVLIVYQSDINDMQRHQQLVHQYAEEAAATAALFTEEGNNISYATYDFANGFIKFKDDAGIKGYENAKKNMGLDSQGKTNDPYFANNSINIITFTFSQDYTYKRFLNGKPEKSGTFSKGVKLSQLCDEPYKSMLEESDLSEQITIDYPSTACIIDCGKPRMSDSLGLSSTDIKICKVGTYEYKHYPY